MKNLKSYNRLILFVGLTIIFSFSGCEKNAKDEPDIIDILSSDSNHSTLVAALQHAGISSIFEDYNPLTVFAPTNTAFDEFLLNSGVNGIEDLSTEYLDSILFYHVLNIELTSSYFSNGYSNTLSAGPDLRAISLLINEAENTLNGNVHIINSDLMASNGVIHVIDKVLVPPTVFEIIKQNGAFGDFVEAVEKADLKSLLNGTGPYTVFVPLDYAFETLLSDLGVSEISEVSKEQWISILKTQVVEGNLRSSDFSTGNITTLNGDIFLETGTSSVINNSANIIAFDMQAKNGIVHVIDEVLTPAKK